ncbi:hypothetical protein [Nocardia sp. NPDC051981]|uniref:hypothetical protein n=1 Tax=Nocardia sp. NPDC051981 TaxID=3155417 RepID=UPI00342D0879
MTTWSEDPKENEAVETLQRLVSDLADTLHKIPDARSADPVYGFMIEYPSA